MCHESLDVASKDMHNHSLVKTTYTDSTHARTYTHIHAHIHTYIYTRTYTHTCTHTRTHAAHRARTVGVNVFLFAPAVALARLLRVLRRVCERAVTSRTDVIGC